MKFENLQQLKTEFNNFDRGELHVPTMQVGDTTVEAKGYKASVNLTTNKVEGIFRDRYQLIEHKQAFKPFIDAIEANKMEVFGNVKNFGGQVVIECLFKGLFVTPKEGDKIQLGVRMENNYGLPYPSFKGDAYGLRTICTNGMVVSQAVAGRVFSAHATEAELRKDILNFIETVFQRSSNLTDIIKKSSEVMIPEEIVKNILVGELESMKRSKNIFNRIKKESEQISKYDLYNGITEYATYESKNEDQRQMIQNIAQKVLIRPVSQLRHGVWIEKKKKVKI